MKKINISKSIMILTCIVVCLVLSISNIYAAKISYPNPTDRFFINDFANVLSSETEQKVYSTCVAINENTTAQLVVVTVKSLESVDIETYSNELFNKWEIGDKSKDNGVLLLISTSDRKVRIEVGYGLEGAINDAKAGRILDNSAIPYLKDNDYDSAVLSVVTELQGIIYNEYGVEGGFDNYAEVEMEEEIEAILTMVLIGIFIFLIVITRGRILFFISGPGRGGFHGGGFSGGGFSGGGGSSGGGGASRGF